MSLTFQFQNNLKELLYPNRGFKLSVISSK